MINKINKTRTVAGPLVLLLLIALLITACGKKTGDSSNDTGSYRKSLNVADEGTAVRTLQNLFRAQTQYMLSHAEEYATFAQLVQDNYLDSRFAGDAPVVAGYAFTMRLTPKSGAEGAAYTVNADPRTEVGTSTAGARHLYMDSTSNVIYANANRPASGTDPPLQ